LTKATSDKEARVVATGVVPVEPTPLILRKIPPGIIVASDAFVKLLAPPATAIQPKNMAFFAVLGASENGSESFAFTASNKEAYSALP